MNSEEISTYQRNVAGRIALRNQGAQYGPNVFESEEQRIEMIAELLSHGINPAAQRVYAVMEDWAEEGTFGSIQFTEMYLQGMAALGFTVVQVVPPRSGEPNSISIKKSGVIQVQYLPTSTEGRDLKDIQHEFAASASETIDRLRNKTLLSDFVPNESLSRGDFRDAEGPASFVLIENAYTLFPELTEKAAREQEVGGPGTSSFIYHPHAANAALADDGTSAYSDLFFRAGKHNATALTISTGSKASFEALMRRAIEQGKEGKAPFFSVKPAGSMASLPEIDPSTVESEYNDGRINLTSMGRLAPEKGPEDAIATFRAVLEGWGNREPALRPRLIMMGKGPLLETIKLENADLIQNGDLVITGMVSDQFKCEMFAISDVLLVTSGIDQESWHLASDEARTYKCLPFALGQIGGIKDGQRKGGGVEVETRNPAVLGNGVLQYICRRHGLEAPKSKVEFEVSTVGKVSHVTGRPTENPSDPDSFNEYVDLPVENRFGPAHEDWAKAAQKMFMQLTPLRDIQLALT